MTQAITDDLLNRPCSIVRRLPGTTDDGYGNEIPDEELVATVVELQESASAEPGDAGELGVTSYLAIFPAGTELEVGDAVLVDGREYEVLGEPAPWRDPFTGKFDHVEATLRRTAGGEDGS